MARKNHRKITRKDKPNGTSNCATLIYIDQNLPTVVAESFTTNSGIENTTHLKASDLGLPDSAPDPVFFDALDTKLKATVSKTQAEAVGIVITADRGKGDKGMIDAINSSSKQDDLISTLIVSSSSISGNLNIHNALHAFPTVKGYRDYGTNPLKYIWVKLHRSGHNLIIRSKNRKSGKIKEDTKRDVF